MVMNRSFTRFPFGVLGEPNIYHNLEDYTRKGDFTWRMSDCEELSGGLLTGDDGGGRLLRVGDSIEIV
jgi:hypothetical protein